MYARVTTIQISPYRVDEAIGVIRDHVVPAAQQQEGFRGFQMLVDRGTGKSFAITIWEKEPDRQVSGPNSTYYREAIGRIVPLLTDTPITEDVEIVIHV
jgi:heme-degrading monooxygenase HmoA